MTWDLCPFACSAVLGSLPGSGATIASNAAADRGPMPLSQAKIGTPETPRLPGPGQGRLPAAHVTGEAGLARYPGSRPDPQGPGGDLGPSPPPERCGEELLRHDQKRHR